jgi:ATP-dependent Clp protease ATP-binding subunit ClpA
MERTGCIARWHSSSSTLDVHRSPKLLIAREGFDPQFGAHPIKRTTP